MIFKGNPGQAKHCPTLGKMFKHMNILQKAVPLKERADMLLECIGHTAQNQRTNQTHLGVYYLLMRHILARGGEKISGKEAIDTLVKAMEDHKDI